MWAMIEKFLIFSIGVLMVRSPARGPADREG
jgi:hypothetical protein